MASKPKLGLFSVLEEMVNRSKANKALTKEQWLQELNPRRDIQIGDVKHPLKKEEIDYSGLNDITEPKTKEELQQLLRDRMLPEVSVHPGDHGYGSYINRGVANDLSLTAHHWRTKPGPGKFDREAAAEDVRIERELWNTARQSLMDNPESIWGQRIKLYDALREDMLDGKAPDVRNPADWPATMRLYEQHPDLKSYINPSHFSSRHELQSFMKDASHMFFPEALRDTEVPILWMEKALRDNYGVEQMARLFRSFSIAEAFPNHPQYFTPPNAPEAAFKAGHFEGDIPLGLLSHARTTGRWNGSRANFPDIHHIEEIQSDWHQAALRNYTADKEGIARLKKELEWLDSNPSMDGIAITKDMSPKEVQWAQAFNRQLANYYGYRTNEAVRRKGLVGAHRLSEDDHAEALARGIADTRERVEEQLARREISLQNSMKGYANMDAPLKGDAWWQNAIRQEILNAVNSGKRYVTLPTGDEQIRRYRDALQKSVDKIDWDVTPEGRFNLRPSKMGRVVSADERLNNLRMEELETVLGKDMADRILAQERKVLTASGAPTGPAAWAKHLFGDSPYIDSLDLYGDPGYAKPWVTNAVSNQERVHQMGALGLMDDDAQTLAYHLRERQKYLDFLRKSEGSDMDMSAIHSHLATQKEAAEQLASKLYGYKYTLDDDSMPFHDLAEHVMKTMETKPVPMAHARSISGGDLAIGGEGMRQYYDQKYLNYLRRLGKQYGGKDFETTLENSPIRGIELTPEMVNALKKQGGLPMWSMGPIATGAAAGLPQLMEQDDGQ